MTNKKGCVISISSQKKILSKILSLFILGFSLTMIKKISKTIIKRYAAIGSPCLALRFRREIFCSLPPFITQLSLPFNKSLTKSIKYLPKPCVSRQLIRKI